MSIIIYLLSHFLPKAGFFYKKVAFALLLSRKDGYILFPTLLNAPHRTPRGDGVIMKNCFLIKKAALCRIVSALLTFTILAVPCSARFSANAEEAPRYLRVIAEDVPFYAFSTDETPLFYLPYTYYVRLIENGERFTRVEFGGDGYTLDGFVPSDKLFYDGQEVDSPFPETEIFTVKTAVLYKDAALTTPVQYLFEGRKLYLYGGFLSPQNQPIYYISYNDKLGYIKEEDITPFVIPDHPNELTFLNTDGGETQEAERAATQESDYGLTLRVAIIAVLALAGFFALFFTAGKKSKATAAGYYDENDYE